MFTRKMFYRFAAPMCLSLCIPLAAFAAGPTPAGGSIGAGTTTGPSWTGAPVGANLIEATCVDGTSCDVYTLTITGSPADYLNKVVNVSATWGLLVEEYDVYIHQGTITGPVIGSSINGPGTSNAVNIDPNLTGVGTYTVHIVADNGTPGSTYQGLAAIVAVVSAPATPAANNTPQATFPAPTYTNLRPPIGLGENSGEPSIGINWNSGSIMSSAVLDTLQLTMDTSTPHGATDHWTLRNNAFSGTTSLDPILFTDHVTGRTFDSQLAGTTSLMAYTDNDGLTWHPTQGGGIASGVDHQTVGGGPFATCALPPTSPPTIPPTTPTPPTPPTANCAALNARGPISQNPLGAYPNAVYYASQDIGTAQMALSRDGGISFELAHSMYNLTQCGGLHGHVKVGPTGKVFLPNKNCSGTQGLVVSQDNGLTFNVLPVTGSTPGASDPSVGVGAGGRVYFGYTDGSGHPKIVVSDDDGVHWSASQDVGFPFGIQSSVFPEVVAGDNDRAAFFFLGTAQTGPATGADTAGIFNGIWHGYIATTIDGGAHWETVDATPNDAVQLGVVCTAGTTCPSGTRNLLDFNDITIDKVGRVYTVYTDGCTTTACLAFGSDPDAAHTKTQNSGSTKQTIIRQATGLSLFSKYDSVPLTP